MREALWRLLGMESKRYPQRPYDIRASWPNFLYVEGDRKVLIHGEWLTGELNYVVYANSFEKWLPPHQDEIIDVSKKAEILARLYDRLDRHGVTYEVEG